MIQANNGLSSFSEIVGYLERQYDYILAEESRIKRNPRFRDNRVHVLLYFITPTGHGYDYKLEHNGWPDTLTQSDFASLISS